jgi:hypothetical protein
MSGPILDFGAMINKETVSFNDIMTNQFLSINCSVQLGMFTIDGVKTRGFLVQRPDNAMTSPKPLKIKTVNAGNIVDRAKAEIGKYTFIPELTWILLYHKVTETVPMNQSRPSGKFKLFIDASKL